MARREFLNLIQNRLSYKLWLYAFAVGIVSFAMTASCLGTLDYFHNKQMAHKQVEQRAELISLVGRDALKTKRRSYLKEILESHTRSGELESVHVYDAEGNLFAFSKENPFSQTISPTVSQSQVVKTVIDGSQVLGMVVVNGNMHPFFSHLYYQILTILGVFSAVCAFVFWITQKLCHTIAVPIDEMKATLDKVIQSNDYSLRAKFTAHSSLNNVLESFNQVLEDIDHKTYALKHSQERLHLALWGSNEVLFDWDLDSDMLYFDEAIESILGLRQEQVPNTLETYLHVVHPNDLSAFQDALTKHLKEEVPFFESEHRIKDATDYRWIFTRGKVVERDEKGQPKRLIGTVGDIQARKEEEAELKLFHEVFSNTTEAIVITDAELRIIQCNQAFTTITGYEMEDVKGKTIEVLYSNEHPAAFYNHIRYSIDTNEAWTGEIIQKRQSGKTYPSHLSISSMANELGQTVHYVCVFNDKTSEQIKEDQLNYLTHFDPLTGLSNREQMKQTIEHNIHLANEAKESFGVVVVGIDSFKTLNDTYGNVVGDEILKAVANRLKPEVNNPKHLSRLGGDEFAFIIPNVNHKEQLEKVATKIIQAISSSLVIDDIELNLGCCVGMSVYPHDGQDMDSMFVNADTAMMQAKKQQRNSYKFFTQSMNQQVSERQKLELMIRKAIENNEFELCYQPKIDVQTGQVAGAEALMRWNSEQLGLVSPDKFVPIAEESGLILPLGEWALNQACRQGQYWASLGWRDFMMAVNVSAMQFKQDTFVDMVTHILFETGFQANQLELELTEGAIIVDMEYCNEILHKLKGAGIKIAIDDFGTGYSSLSYIKQFPIDVLKIDKAFVRKMISSTEDSHIVAAVLSMAKGLNFKTVAEGVENLEQVQQLSKLGCDYIQGFYYNRPITASEFESYYAQVNRTQMNHQGKDAS